jgi:hypothetical protein
LDSLAGSSRILTGVFRNRSVVSGSPLPRDRILPPTPHTPPTGHALPSESGDELMALEREKRIFEAIRSGDVNGASNQFIVGWLAPHLLTHDSECIYHCNESGDLVSLSSSSSPLSGLVLEAGGATLSLSSSPDLLLRSDSFVIVFPSAAFSRRMHGVRRADRVHLQIMLQQFLALREKPGGDQEARWRGH